MYTFIRRQTEYNIIQIEYYSKEWTVKTNVKKLYNNLNSIKIITKLV